MDLAREGGVFKIQCTEVPSTFESPGEESALKPAASFRWKLVRGSLISAVILLFMDGLLYGSFLLSVFAIPIWLLIAVIRGIFWRKNWRAAIARILIPICTAILVLANAWVQEKLAEAKADRIIAACYRYQADNGKLPDKLGDLVSKYMFWIPPAKYCLFGEFLYDGRQKSHSLIFIVIPPFYTGDYSFEDGKWWYSD
jgi:hypothetical protein